MLIKKNTSKCKIKTKQNKRDKKTAASLCYYDKLKSLVHVALSMDHKQKKALT